MAPRNQLFRVPSPDPKGRREDDDPGLPLGHPAPPPPVPLDLHHIGVAVKSLSRAIDTYVGTLGYRKVSTVLDVPSESVRVCFVESPSGVLVELVEGIGEHSPVARVLSQPGAGPYHLCYAVPDIDEAIADLRRHRCFLLKQFERPAHGYRRFAFLLTPDRQLFELCEVDPNADDPLTSHQPTRYAFETLFFEATRLCNLACPMCMASSNDKSLVRESVKRQLDTDEIERHILATAHEIGIHTITWSGGEFLLRPDAIEIVRRATAHGYSSTVCTNAVKTDRARLEALRDAAGDALVVAVGINSIEDENSWTRDAEKDLSLDVLDLCEELGIRRHVVVNVGKHNLETLDRTFAWLEEHNIPFNRSPYTARGHGCDYWDQLAFSREDMEQTIHPELRKRPHGYISYTPLFLSPEVHERYSQGHRNVTVPQNPPIGCWCGTWLAVNAEGDVSPCGILLDDVRCGNVREMTFQEILDRSPVFQKLLDRHLLEGKCGRCRYQFVCGGCRAMAYYHDGNLFGEDPTCFFEPVDASTVSEHEEETNRMFRRYAFMARQAAKGRRQPRAGAASAVSSEAQTPSKR